MASVRDLRTFLAECGDAVWRPDGSISDIPVLCNMTASRAVTAKVLGLSDHQLGEAGAGRSYFHRPHCQNEFEVDTAREIVLVPGS